MTSTSLRAAAWAGDHEPDQLPRLVSLAKVRCSEAFLHAANEAIQMHGGGGVTTDFGLGFAYAHARVLRLVDGPDEVHRYQLARTELAKYKAARPN